ncbi:MAG: putative Ig domain-containing protein [Pirellulales bacterium]
MIDRWTVVVNRRFGLLLDAQEPDHDALIFALISGPAGMNVSTGGALTWTPTDLGSFEAVVQVTDSRGLSDTKTLHFISEAKPPASSLTITSVPITAAVTDELYSYDVKAAAGNAFELLTKPDGMSIDAARGTIRWQPTKDHLGVQTVKLRVSDSFGNTVTQSFSLTVRSSSIVPTISSAPPTEAAVGQTLVYAVELVNPSRSPITFSLSAAPNGMTIDSQSGVITWTPSVLQVGSATVVIRAADAVGNYSSQSFGISVSAGSLNRPPVITSSASLDAIVGQTYTYTLQGSDPDGSSLTYAVRSAPAGLTVQSTTGLVSWNPQAADIGSVNVVLTAVDPQGGAAVQSLVIQVRPANQAPVIRSAPTLKVAQEGLYQYDVIAADPDREPLFYELTDAPIGMTVDALGRVRWQTQLDTPLGARQVVVRVHDSLGAAVTHGVIPLRLLPIRKRAIDDYHRRRTGTLSMDDSAAIVRVIASDDVKLASVQLKVDGEPVELAADGTVRVFFKEPPRASGSDCNRRCGEHRTSDRPRFHAAVKEDGSGNPAPGLGHNKYRTRC